MNDMNTNVEDFETLSIIYSDGEKFRYKDGYMVSVTATNLLFNVNDFIITHAISDIRKLSIKPKETK